MEVHRPARTDGQARGRAPGVGGKVRTVRPGTGTGADTSARTGTGTGARSGTGDSAALPAA